MRIDGESDWRALCRNLAFDGVLADQSAVIDSRLRTSSNGREADLLEAFARTFLMFAMSESREPAAPDARREAAWEAVVAGFERAFSHGSTKPWPHPDATKQAVVEAAAVALGTLALGERLTDRLSDAALSGLLAWTADCARVAATTSNNWRLFALPIAGLQLHVGGPSDVWRPQIEDVLDVIDAWYAGGGWYSDGAGRTFDHYNSFAFHFYPLVTAHVMGESPWRPAHVERLLAYLPALRSLVADSGAPVRIGRSLTYRAAVVAPYSVALLTGHAPPWVQHELDQTMNHFLEAGMVSPNGLIELGSGSADDVTAQSYSGALASYWVAKAFVHLLPPRAEVVAETAVDDTTTPAEISVLEPPGFLVHRSPGLVRVANHGSYDRVESDVRQRSGVAVYTHLEYSSATSPLRSPEAHAGSLLVQIGRRTFERSKPLTVDVTSRALTSTWLLRPADAADIAADHGPVRRQLRRRRVQRVLDRMRPLLTVTTKEADGELVHAFVVSRTSGRPFRLTFTGLPVDGLDAVVQRDPETVTVRGGSWSSSITAHVGFTRLAVATGLGPTANGVDACAPVARSPWRWSGGGTLGTRYAATGEGAVPSDPTVHHDLRSPLVAVATYRRPDGLRALLTSVGPQLADGARVVVVDNDAEPSAVATVEDVRREWGAEGHRIIYVHEPQPGIATARNAALDTFKGSDHDCIVFVDDDEVVEAGWLAALTGHADVSGADVVAGFVRSTFPVDTPRWILEAGFIQQAPVTTGTRAVTAATNTTLLRRSAWENHGQPRFDAAFSETGGSDTAFFMGLHRHGAVIEQCAEAVVTEPVAPSRLTARWLTRRAFRIGSGKSRTLYLGYSRSRRLLLGLHQTAFGLRRLAADLLSGRGVRATTFNTVTGGLGVIAEVLRLRLREYRRS